MSATTKAPEAIKIERGIPLPKYTKMPKNDLVSDLKKMQPLESRLIDEDFNEQTLNTVRTRIHAIVQREKLTKRKFTVNVDPIGKKKLRVWRVL